MIGNVLIHGSLLIALLSSFLQPLAADGAAPTGTGDVVPLDVTASTTYLPLTWSAGDLSARSALEATITAVLGLAPNAVLAGRVYLGVETRGAVDRVVFRLDGPKTTTWTEYGAPWWFMGNTGDDRTGWDTTGFPDGVYTLTITAIGHDNRTARTARMFTLANQFNPADSSIGRDGVFISPARVQAIRQAVRERREPNDAAYQRLRDECDGAMREAPNPPRTLVVPNFYENPVGHGRAKAPVKNDANNAYALALCYRITEDESFARAAVRIIRAWSTTLTHIDTRDNAALVFSYHFPSMIFAADLLRGAPAYTTEIEQEFSTFLTTTALAGSTIDTVSRVGCGYKSGVPLTNNWSNWGIVLSMAIAVFTGDTPLYTESVQKWRSNVNIQIDNGGDLPIEGRRNDCSGDTGLHYTNYAMQPLTIAAEIAFNSGTNLYQDPRYQRAVQRTAEVDRYPSRFPFYQHQDREYVDMRYKVAWLEVARNHIDDSNADWLLQQFRPVATPEVIRYATLTHGNLPLR